MKHLIASLRKRPGNASNHNSADRIASQLSHASFCNSQEDVMDHDHDSLLWIKVEGRK